MINPIYSFIANVWAYPGDAAWYFLTLPENIGKEIKSLGFGMGRGFGSVPVHVTVGDVSWDTSIFPDSKSGSYMLPVKKEIRSELSLIDGSSVEVQFSVRI